MKISLSTRCAVEGMCSINVRKLLAKNTSISSQLTLFYSLATFLLIAIISIFFYLGMIRVLYNADHQFLSDEINIIKNILKSNTNNLSSLRQEVTAIPYALDNSVYHYYVRIFDENQKVVVATPKIEQINPKEIKTLTSDKKLWWWRLNNTKRYLLMSSAATINKPNHVWSIQVILDINYQNSVIKNYRRNGLLVLLGGGIISILIGALIARRGLSRLTELTNLTKKITTQTLQQRIDPKLWPAELHELAVAYNHMLDRLESAITRLTAFSDDLAHELRTPITNLMVATELALAPSYPMEAYQSVMESNLEELNRLYQIIENILFLAQAENPRLTVQKELLHIHHEINVLCHYYQAIADEKNIKLSCEGEAKAYANSIMLRQMIGNILSNALKYSFANSEIKFNINEVNNMVQIILIDTGIGIDEKNLSNIFDRFYRTDTARSQNTSGNGLGLAIVKSIVDLHNGTILVLSEINKGTKIIITLPK